MGAIFSMAGSFLTSCLGSLTGTCCAKALGVGTLKQDASRIGYLILNLYTIILALSMGSLFGSNKDLQWWFGYLPGIGECRRVDDGKVGIEACFYGGIIHRITFTYTLMHVTILLLCTCGDSLGRRANNRYFVLKFVMIPVVAFALCFAPNDMFHFLFVTLVSACIIYVLMQQVMLIDLAYSWNEAWVEIAENEYSDNETLSRVWFAAIILFSVLFLAFGCYYFYLSLTRCMWFAVVLLLQVACLVASLTEYIPHGALLPSSLMFAYSAWLSASSGLQGVVGWTLYALTTIYAMTKAAKGGTSVNGNDSSVRLSESLTNVAQPESSQNQRDPPDSETAKSLALLHLCGTLIGLYLGPAIMGVLPEWLCPTAAVTVTFLYGWTLVAPL
ncbi:Serine incorporator 3, partial [Perkinsus olseni]